MNTGPVPKSQECAKGANIPSSRCVLFLKNAADECKGSKGQGAEQGGGASFRAVEQGCRSSFGRVLQVQRIALVLRACC